MKSLTIVLILIFASAVSCYGQRKPSSGTKQKAVSKSLSGMLSMLQGRWSSLDDKKSFFRIEGNRQIDIYGRDNLDTSTVNFYEECPDRISAEDEQRKSGKYLVVERKQGDFNCYSIENISQQQLVLMYLPRGNFLRYKKVN